MSIAILVVAAGLLVGGGISRNNIMLWVSTGMWLLLGVIMYGQSSTPGTGIWDWQYGMSYISFFVTFAVALYAGHVEYRSSKERRIKRAEEAREAKLDDMSDYMDEDDETERREYARMVSIYDSRVGKPKKLTEKERQAREDREFRRVMRRAERNRS